MDQDLHHELRPERADDLRREAKRLLRAVRDGDDAAARDRAREALGDRFDERFVLADALHVVATERGYRSWPALKHALAAEAAGAVRPVHRVGAFGQDVYAGWADQLLHGALDGERDAVDRLRGRVERLRDGGTPSVADARLCLAREFGFRTWAELAATTDRHRDTHYSRLDPALPWKQGEAAIRAHDAVALAGLLERHPGLEDEDPGMTLIVATAQPEAGAVPREVVDVLIEAGSALDDALGIAACFDKPDLVGWLLDAGADPALAEGVSPLESAAYHGSRRAADVLVDRTGIVPDHFHLAAAAGDVERLAAWFDGAALRSAAVADRADFSDVGWPGRAVSDDPADVLAEALALAAHLGRVDACRFLLDRGADPARAPLYGLTPLHFAASMGLRETAELLVAGGAPLRVTDNLHGGTPRGWAEHGGHDHLLDLL